MMLRFLPTITLTVLLAAPMANAQETTTQSPSGDIGIGGQIGDPSGVSFKLYRGRARGEKFLGAARAAELVAAWDLDRFISLTGHGLVEEPIEDSPLNYFLGPGLVVGVDSPRGDADIVLGVSAVVGVNFFSGRYEIYLQATPIMKLIPESDGYLGGSIGFRVYFGTRLISPAGSQEPTQNYLV